MSRLRAGHPRENGSILGKEMLIRNVDTGSGFYLASSEADTGKADWKWSQPIWPAQTQTVRRFATSEQAPLLTGQDSDIFLFATTSKSALMATQALLQCVPGILVLEKRWQIYGSDVCCDVKNDPVLSHREIFEQVSIYTHSKSPIAPIMPIFI